MNSNTQGQIELSAVLNLVPYLDVNINSNQEMSITDFVKQCDGQVKGKEALEAYNVLKSVIQQNSSYGDIILVNRSSTNDTTKWTDDLIQACTFKDSDGNYYVAYRGTGSGRWRDNGDGMVSSETQMQESAKEYFDFMAKEYFADAKAQGKQITVTGHSKGGNEAQYVYMASEYEYLIDNCYSFDGQGFSRGARANFINKYGLSYEEKLSKMYSICGEDDYVHDLGYVIIPKENTYFTATSGDSMESLHALGNMVSDDDGNYVGLQWTTENGEIVNGDQGEIGNLAKKLSEIMMTMDEEDLHGSAIAMMDLVDKLRSSNSEALGDVNVTGLDYIDLLAHGLPAILYTVFLTEEGHELLGGALEQVYDKYGTAGVLFVLQPLCLCSAFYATKFVIDVIVVSTIMEYVVEKIYSLVKVNRKIQWYVSEIVNATIAAVNKIIGKIRLFDEGYRYASSNPQIVVDTLKLKDYAQRLKKSCERISQIDKRLDALYTSVGLQNIWNLMRVDFNLGYSRDLVRCTSYLNDTAKDFESLERTIMNKL